jgi:hypothetical protein
MFFIVQPPGAQAYSIRHPGGGARIRKKWLGKKSGQAPRGLA